MGDRWIVDSVPSTRYPIYTRANVGEVFPDPVAPLSATLGITEQAEPGWRDALERFGAFTAGEFDPDNNEIIGVFGGYCYLNLSLSRILAVRTPGLTPETIDRTFFGGQPGVPPYQPRPTDADGERTAAVHQTLQWILTTTELPELLDDQSVVNDLRDTRPDLAALSDDELVARTRSLMSDHFRRLFGRHIFTTYCSTVPVGIVEQVCTQIGRPELTLRLIAGVGDLESAAPSWALWDLGRLVADDPALTTEFDAGIPGVLDPLRAQADAGEATAEKFLSGIDDFVREFGCRGPNEWEPRCPTWETEPELALACIDRMRLVQPADSPTANQQARAEERQRLSSEIIEDLAGDHETQQQFAAATRAAAVFLAGRERSKTNAVKLTHEVRMTTRELGRRLVERGHLERLEDLGMLRHDEFDAFLADPAPWRAEIRSRLDRYDALGRLEPPFVFEGRPPPPGTWEGRDTHPVSVAEPGEVLTGLPGCPGRATGRARVLLDLHDPSTLEPGDVLVAPITDPSWTPLFVPAGAVVVDVGAPLSHAVIVSRELGIPCVVSVTHATRRIPDGALVTVDGDTGTVTVAEERA